MNYNFVNVIKKSVFDILIGYFNTQEEMKDGTWSFESPHGVDYDIIINSRLGKFTYKFNNSNAYMTVFVKDNRKIIIENGMKLKSSYIDSSNLGYLPYEDFLELQQVLIDCKNYKEVDKLFNNQNNNQLQKVDELVKKINLVLMKNSVKDIKIGDIYEPLKDILTIAESTKEKEIILNIYHKVMEINKTYSIIDDLIDRTYSYIKKLYDEDK